MRLSAKNVIKLMRFTRRYDPYGNPILWKFSRWLQKKLYPQPNANEAHELVVPYDSGLININTSSNIEYRILFRQYPEPEIARLIKHVVTPGAVCLDVGANIGAYTLLMAFCAGPTGKVISLEPHPHLCERLLKNVALNGLQNVEVLQAALSDSNGEAPLYTYEEGAQEQTTSSLLPAQGLPAEVRVQTVTGHTLQEEYDLSSCSLIKLDVEGHESVCLRQLSDVIAGSHPLILCEYVKKNWDRANASLNDTRKFLQTHGYDIYCVHNELMQPLKSPPHKCDLFCVPCTNAWNLAGRARPAPSVGQ